MLRGKRLLALSAIALAVFALVGCESGPTEEEIKAAAAAEAWTALEQAKAELDGKRNELATLREQIANSDDEAPAESAEGEEGAEAPPSPEELAARRFRPRCSARDCLEYAIKFNLPNL